MKIGIIGGTGPQGLGIAKRLAIAGEDVIVGSRKEEKALTVVGEANEEIKEHNPKELVGMANEDAAAAADVLILTVPLQAQSATLKTIKENAKGKRCCHSGPLLCGRCRTGNCGLCRRFVLFK